MVIVHENKIFKKETGKYRKGFYLDQRLKDNIDNYLVKPVSKKWDGVVLITGMEGSAKSTMAQALSYYVDPSFSDTKRVVRNGKEYDLVIPKDQSVDRIVFTQEQFMKAVDNAKKGQAIIWDEFVMGGLSTEALGKQQNELIKYMTTIRKKQLYIFMIIPSIFMLRLYFILRTRFLIHCYTPDGVKRGFFKFYSYDRKRELFVKGRKYFSMKVAQSNFAGRFTDTTGFFTNMELYENKKDETIKSIGQEEEKKKDEKSKHLQEWKRKAHMYLSCWFADLNKIQRLEGDKEYTINKLYYDRVEPLVKDTVSLSAVTKGLQAGRKWAREEQLPLSHELEPNST